MNRNTLKKLGMVLGLVSLLLLTVLCVHIYIVTRPKAIDPKAIVMARIDMHQDINQEDANRIISYMNSQICVNHTYVNPQSDIVVFTFFPAQASGNDIVKKFKTDLHYENAVRFMPTAAQLSAGCPAGYGSDNSLSSKLVSLFK